MAGSGAAGSRKGSSELGSWWRFCCSGVRVARRSPHRRTNDAVARSEPLSTHLIVVALLFPSASASAPSAAPLDEEASFSSKPSRCISE